jgi:hypothetical protein
MKLFRLLRASAALIPVVFLVLRLSIPAHAQTALSGTWSVQTESDLNTAQFGVRYDSDHEHSDWSRDVPMSSLAGLTRDQLQSGGTDVRFDVVRDAGTLHCVGYVAHGAGGGAFTFAPSASFSDALASRGISRPDDVQQLRMAMANVTIAFVDVLRRNSSDITSSDDIIRVLNHGVDEAYINGLAALGYRNLGADDLVRMRDHGVTLDYVQAMLALGYRPTPQDLVRMRDHGVRPDFAKGMIAFGYRPTVDDLVRLRDHGVSLDFVKRMKEHGYNVDIEQLIRLRDSGID